MNIKRNKFITGLSLSGQSMNNKKNKDCCPICGNNRISFFYSELNLNLYKCSSCDVVFVHPLPSEIVFKENLELNYIILAQKYSKVVEPSIQKEDPKQREIWENEKRAIFKSDLTVIKAYNKNKTQVATSLLDIGCGEGLFMVEAERDGFVCEGLEPSKNHIPSKELKLKIFNGFLKNFKSKIKYDVITMLDSLEHTKDPLGELNAVRRIIKKQGILMIRVPNLRWLMIKEKIIRFLCAVTGKKILDFNPQGIYAPHTHLYNFSEAGIKKILASANFNVVGTEIINASHTEKKYKALFYILYYGAVKVIHKVTKINTAISLNIIAVPAEIHNIDKLSSDSLKNGS